MNERRNIALSELGCPATIHHPLDKQSRDKSSKLPYSLAETKDHYSSVIEKTWRIRFEGLES